MNKNKNKEDFATDEPSIKIELQLPDPFTPLTRLRGQISLGVWRDASWSVSEQRQGYKTNSVHRGSNERGRSHHIYSF